MEHIMARTLLIILLSLGFSGFAKDKNTNSKALVKLNKSELKLLNQISKDLSSHNFRTRLTAQKSLKKMAWHLKFFLHDKLKHEDDPELQRIAKTLEKELDIRLAERVPSLQFTHQISREDTLIGIANFYRTKVHWIKTANNIKTDSELKKARMIYIPVEKLQFTKIK